MGKKLIIACSIVSMLFAGCSVTQDQAVSWANENDAPKLEEWLKAGGDPNLRNHERCTLLYVATGPHGGNDVVRVLIAHAADVNAGCGKYTPLMNAASWANDDAIELLLKAGADPNLKNENGQQAIDLIGDNGNRTNQDRIRQTLLAAMTNGR
jgi:ankyrin repeat protein